MKIADKYIAGLKAAHLAYDLDFEWNEFERVKHGAAASDLERLRALYPECPQALLDLLDYADGTYHRKYGDESIALFFFGSDVVDYPYYLLSAAEMLENRNIAREYYSDYIERKYEGVKIDKRISDCADSLVWLHFSDCMNNGGTSQLFIDFSPAPGGKKGQIVRFLHDPDEFAVIAEGFDDYLLELMSKDYSFINEDAVC